MVTNSSRMKNGLKNNKNTTEPSSLLNKLKKSSPLDLQEELLSSKRMQFNQDHHNPLFNFLNISLNLPRKETSRDKDGLKSSNFWPKSLPLPQSKLMLVMLDKLLNYVINYLTKLLNQEKSKEEITNTGLMNTNKTDKDKSIN